ncbi:cilia- and flagella-associated protein 53-like [Halichondria panicea]|uniref:cilia- and flagella-associated protein 53-like n=1 Tax=Halichondria panicea TaxID=6063 RepID=UPI00312B72B3
MELSAVRIRRSREVTGHTPHSVAIHAKPSMGRPRDHLILERRRQDELREEVNTIIKYSKQFDLKTKWVETTDKKIQKNTIQRRMESLLKQQQFSLEERRDQLRSLLKTEEEQYLIEMAGRQETPLEKQAKMRERARSLKEKREAERLALVERKLEQRWRGQCEELRSIQSKHHQDGVCEERAEQLRLNAEKKRIKEQEEQFYAGLWEKDRLAKCAREEMDGVLQIERNKEMIKALTLQTASKNEQLQDQKRLKEQEADLLREDAAIRAMEEQQMKEEKRRTQARRKMDIDYSLKLKLKKQAKEAQEELAMDMRLLEQVLTESSNEAMHHLNKKNQLRDEVKCYRDYLASQAEEEKNKEKELDALLNEEVQKQWAKRVNQWRMEREARKKLLQNVLETRKKQIQEKLAKIQEEKLVEEKEREQLLINFEKHRQLEQKQKEENMLVKLDYQRHLQQQMGYTRAVKKLEEEQTQREITIGREEELLYKRRVQNALARPDPDKTHPKRFLLTGQQLF